MKKEILIFGGTQYVGKALINLLHAKGYDITIATRGSFPIPLGENVKHVKLDRYDVSTFPESVDREWDLVIDQLSLFGEDAKIVADFFKRKAKHFIVISSSAVYDESLDASEEQFDPMTYKLNLKPDEDRPEVVHGGESYREGKRATEAYYMQNVESCTLVRFPQIFGINDLSNRLLEVIICIKNEKEIPTTNDTKKCSLIHSRDAARFLSWIVDHPFHGPINASSLGSEDIYSLVEKLGGSRDLIKKNKEKDLSIFVGNEVLLNTDMAKKKGFIFEENSIWLDEVSRIWRYYIGYIQDFKEV
ncbi:hypothetical protein A9Q84_13685 [Halobacteriovorax marinus]|uniref:NAD-dependent epimerase/dehydratase domain-containing protein n=1 Tax=Halobacteriovorax marinus TaxID=97084 RepID=A0A1Y5FD41_9BACT|nr:hypothetical protein A9Q84_13685 [Halobacteriovorax marinus]